MIRTYNTQMTEVNNFKDISKYIINSSSNETTIVYFDLINLIKLSKTNEILYKTVPSLRTKILTINKSLNINLLSVLQNVFDTFKIISDKTKICVLIDDNEIISKIKTLFPSIIIQNNHNVFYSNIQIEKNNLIGVYLK